MGIRRERIILWVGIIAAALLMSSVAIWKYTTFQMNGIDLAYFNQVFWNTVHGRPFGLTIHPHLSLGDHAEFFILALAPLYAIAQRPETLLILQAIALAICGWPVYRIAKRFLPDAWPLVLGLSTAFSPFLQNASLYEFHILVFALPLILFAADAYAARSLPRFLGFILLALTVREDVALVTVAFGIVASIDRRNWKWIVLPTLISGAWFLGAMKLISHFAIGGSYKFATYYSWILDGVTLREFAAHFTTLPTLEFFLGILMPFLFLPLLRPKWLLLAALPAAQQMLTSSGAGAVVFQMHYVVLLLPGLILATVDAISHWPPRFHGLVHGTAMIPRNLLMMIFVISTLYGIITLGPIPAAARMIARGEPDPKLVAAKRAVVSRISLTSSILASYDFLPALSSRERLYTLHYAYPGVAQFSATGYIFPDPDEIILNEEDFLIFALNFPTLGWTREHYQTGDDRLHALLSRGYELAGVRGPIMRFRRSGMNSIPLVSVSDGTLDSGGIEAARGIRLLTAEKTSCPTDGDFCLLFSFERNGYKPEVVEPFLAISLRDETNRIIREEIRPLGFGFFPPSAWPNKKTVMLTVPLILPDDFSPSFAEIRLVRPEGVLAFSGVRSGYPLLTNLIPLGPPMTIPLEARP